MPNLYRFRDAQVSGFDAALRELRAGRKTSHWIWYVFPQLAALGQSDRAIYYGLAGTEEAAEYVRDHVLCARLVEAAAVVRNHLAGTEAQPIRLEQLMGSRIDALKLVSCMTLFRHVARTLHAVDPQPQFVTMAAHADAILAAAAAQGYRPCAFTENHLRGLST